MTEGKELKGPVWRYQTDSLRGAMMLAAPNDGLARFVGQRFVPVAAVSASGEITEWANEGSQPVSIIFSTNVSGRPHVVVNYEARYLVTDMREAFMNKDGDLFIGPVTAYDDRDTAIMAAVMMTTMSLLRRAL